MTSSALLLPRFTFLSGPPNSGQVELAQAINKLDPDLYQFDFEEPLRLCAQQLFLGGFDPDFDLTNPEIRKLPLPHIITTLKIDYNAFLFDFAEWIRDWYGAEILGRLALADHKRNEAAVPHLHRRLLFRDATPFDVRVFENEFPERCLVIHLGSINNKLAQSFGRTTYHIWLPEPSPEARMSRLRIELETRNTLRSAL